MLIAVLVLALSALGSCLGGPVPATTTAGQPEIYSPVLLSEFCNGPDNYCFYVDQNKPGSVRASPYSATDEQGGFLLQRHLYLSSPYKVCYGGCCIEFDFTKAAGCVQMRYVSRHSSEQGHLLARFANDPQQIIGPQSYHAKQLTSCPSNGAPIPYALIAARNAKAIPHSPSQNAKPTAPNPHSTLPQAKQLQPDKPVHDYFDDIIVAMNEQP